MPGKAKSEVVVARIAGRSAIVAGLVAAVVSALATLATIPYAASLSLQQLPSEQSIIQRYSAYASLAEGRILPQEHLELDFIRREFAAAALYDSDTLEKISRKRGDEICLNNNSDVCREVQLEYISEIRREFGQDEVEPEVLRMFLAPSWRVVDGFLEEEIIIGQPYDYIVVEPDLVDPVEN